MIKPYIYIASPYSIGDKEANVHASIEVAETIVNMGGIPYLPLLTHYWEAQYHHEHLFWIVYGLDWLNQCDMMLRLPGESAGCDIEEAYARNERIPIAYSLDTLGAMINEWARTNDEIADYYNQGYIEISEGGIAPYVDNQSSLE